MRHPDQRTRPAQAGTDARGHNRWRIPTIAAVLTALLGGSLGCTPRPATGTSPSPTAVPTSTEGREDALAGSNPVPEEPRLTRVAVDGALGAQRDGPSPIRFRDITASTGIAFVHCSGNSPEKEFPTCLGSGVALLDSDGDGWLDVYFATTRNLPLEASDRSQGNRLYRNRHDGSFEDVTQRAGVGFHGFGHGVTVGDVNNDGRPDLYLANLGRNVLYLNNGDGTFRDATAGAGLTCPGWSCGAAFLDYDNDGWLDLYVSQYGEWSPDIPRPFCGDKARNIRTICTPTLIAPRRHSLFRNRGDGSFEDTTVAAGLARHDGRGLGVVAADLDRDGRIDLYVANDKCPNFLFLNRGDGSFADVSETSGAAGNAAGEYQGSMGVDAQDLDGDGWPELVVTNFRGEGTTLYRNVEGGNFLDVSAFAGILRDSKPYVGWGVALEDFDSDGRPDLLVVNGHVDDNLPLFEQDIPQAEPAKVWRNHGVTGKHIQFSNVPDPGPFFAIPHVARGAAFGDLDNDGDLDMVISRLDQPPAILLNESPPRSWIRLELTGRRSNRSAIGAAVEVHAGGRVFHRQVKGGSSYISANDSRVLVGLGDCERVDFVFVRWPSGARSELSDPAPRRTHVLHEPDMAGSDGSTDRAHHLNRSAGTGGLPASAKDVRSPEGRP
jgi:enediyne biosynthesis protein E4